jgi:hypothetical protein
VQHTIFSLADLYRVHFDVMLRKLVSQQQSRSQGIDKPTVSRFYLTVEFDDKVLMTRTMRRNTIFHRVPHQSPFRHPTKIERFSSIADTVESRMILVLVFVLSG